MRFIAALLLGLMLVGCTGQISPQNRDLEGIAPEEPNTVRVFLNVDGQPNAGIVCLDGNEGEHVGFISSSNDGALRELTPEATAILCTGQGGAGLGENTAP